MCRPIRHVRIEGMRDAILCFVLGKRVSCERRVGKGEGGIRTYGST